jgi:glutamyl/glutaminyl-tRNA synthetase
LIYEAFGWEIPGFAHLTMILDVDGSRLSKRKGARSLLEYEDDGFIREAMVNYLALLGWGTRESQNIFKISELISKFSLARCTSSSAIFDNQKLLWLNAHHIKNLSSDEIYRRSFRILKEAGLDVYPREKIERAISLEKEKIKKLSDIPHLIDFMLRDDFEYEEDVLERAEESAEVLKELLEIMKNLEVFSAPEIEKKVRQYSKEKNLKTKFVFHPLRWAVSGRTKGPSLFEMCEFIGRERVVERIALLLSKIG